MEGDPSRVTNATNTCLTLHSRALCAVCGASAIGRNFDAYTCLSCKAFFRRNAYNDFLRYSCRTSGSCQITIATRRHCSACRLNKCFQQGMKKELIRSLTAINQATSGLLMNRHLHEQQSLRSTGMDLVPINDQSVLLLDDWNLLTNIRNAYEDYCIEPFLASHEIIPLAITTQPYRSRMKIQRLVDLKQKYLSVIVSFMKRILQSNTTIQNHYEYIKDNLRTLLTLNASELMKSNVLKNVPWENDRLLFESVLTENFMQRIDAHLHIYLTFSPYDPMFVRLFVIILALTSRISPLFKKTQYYSKDFHPFPKEILLAQNYYISLLWKYVIYRLGYGDAILFIVRFIQHFLHRQIMEADMMDIIQNRNDHGQFVGLIQAATDI